MSRELKHCWLICLLIVLVLSVYPLIMGVRVLADVLRYGFVYSANYPKYVIPYMPISLAVLSAVLVMPWLVRLRRPVLAASVLAMAVFLGAELLLEQVMVQGWMSARLESWQMFMCYQPIQSAETATYALRLPEALTEVEVLMGEYDPSFKLHFYMISAVLILAAVSSCYGFARVKPENRRRIRLLMAQATATGAFLALCVLACFTAFFRDGSLLVSPLSAGLMAAFFILLGVTAGIFVGSALQGKRPALAIGLPGLIAALVTLLMYLGEMALLSGHLYRFGTGFLFDGLGVLVLAPVDVLIVLAAGLLCAAVLKGLGARAS